MGFTSTSTLPTVCGAGTYSTDGSACTNCPAGSYCANPTVAPVACGTGYYSSSGSSSCLPCPGGALCSSTTVGSTCSSGTYVLPLTYATTCNACTTGMYCPSTANSPLTCPVGSMPNAGQTSCVVCTAGHCCPAGVDAGSCSTGQYAPAGSSSCLACPDGFMCAAAGTSTPTACGAGYYSNSGRTACVQCEQGYECPTGHSATRVACGTNMYSNVGASICTALTSSQTSSSTSSSTVATCSSGYYISTPGTCTICPAGSYCPDIYTMYSCPSGTYSTSGAITCTICPAGSACPNTDGTSITVCSSGSYALPASTVCTPCSIGHYCPNTDRPLEKECDEGYYASSTGMPACVICPADYNCRDKKSATACPTHYYSLAGWGECRLCPAGQSCAGGPTPTDCAAGTYSPEGNKDCLTCPAGAYCPAKSSRPSICQAGKYSPAGVATCTDCSLGEYSHDGATSCTQCPAGFYCPTTYGTPVKCGHSYYSTAGHASCTLCAIGYPCVPGSTTSSPTNSMCPRGAYCPSATVDSTFVISIVPCPAGTYGTVAGQSISTSACTACGAGYYCPLQGMTLQLPCPKGAYCPASSTDATLCAAGTYNPTVGASSTSSCNVCPAGSYCPSGASEPIACATGSFCAAGASDSGSKCLAGTYSSSKPITQASDCTSCPAGAYCPAASTAPVLCPPGTYNSLTSQSAPASCLACSAGKACPIYGNLADSGVSCSPGYYCPAGTAYPTQYPCVAGKYSDAIDAADSGTCVTCPKGWYCLAGTNRFTNPMVKCPAGYYCLDGTATSDQYPCDAGKYLPFTGAIAATECLYLCPPGKYCPAGSANPAGECKDGYYCPEGSAKEDQNACPAGTYSPSVGLKSSNECVTCPAGYYCPEASTASSYLALKCKAGTYNPSTGMGTAAACLTCSAGYYCPTDAGTVQIGCGYGYYSAAGATVCTLCGATYYCNTPTTTAAAISGNVNACEAGYVCPDGVGEYPAESLLCPAGKYCGLRTVDPTPCPPGTYYPFMGGKLLADCITTPAGKYSVRGSVTPTGDCAAGFYCPAGSIRARMVPCPVGSFRSKTNGARVEDCGPCPAGYFCTIGCATPRPCPVGMYCLAAAEKPTKCPQGYFGASPYLRSSGQCTACWSGRFCSVGGLTLPDGECDPGYYCISNSYVPNPTDGTTGALCPAGGYCPKGSKAAQPCLPGTYSDTTGMKASSECKTCTQGKYCLGEVIVGVSGSCMAGYYCPTGSKTAREVAADPGYFTLGNTWLETKCSAGSYTPDYAQSSCTFCPAGYMCAGPGNTGTFVNCPAGQYCPLGSYAGIDCPAGTYSPITNLQAASDCTACPPGEYCVGGMATVSGQTNAGIYSASGASSASSGIQCTMGHYCPAGTGIPIPCDAGTYNPSTGSTASSACSTCTAGKYCSKNGLSAPEGDCFQGYYCPAGSSSPRPTAYSCAKGQYCPAGSVAPISCLPGYYQNSVKQGSCMPCPRGYYCPSGSIAFASHDCAAGYYCPEASAIATQNACPAGTYNPNTNAFSSNQCVACTPGYYCPNTAQTAVDTTALCAAGYYCILGAKVSNPADSTGGKCSAGYYCPSGTSYPMPCPPGKACPSAGMSTPGSACAAGYYCTLVATTTTPTSTAQGGGACAAGYYCGAGSSAPTPCPVGTYSASPLQTSLTACTLCDDGYYCDQLAATVKAGMCDAGYYCIKDGSMTVGFRTPRPADHICPKGYYCTQGTTALQPCASTDYQDLTGKTSCSPCPAGYWCSATAKTYCDPSVTKTSFYCPAGQRDIVSCADGYYDVQAGSSSSSDCKACPAGKYCPQNPGTSEGKVNECPAGHYCAEGTGTSQGVVCGVGYYCPAAIAAEMACPPGRYCGTAGLSDTDIVTLKCQAGYYCMGKATIPNPTDGMTGVICPAGNYCPEGTGEPIACPPGTYRSSTGGAILADCTTCTAAEYCPRRGLTTPVTPCPAGYYCPIGTAQGTKYPCDPGYMCPAGSASETLCPYNSYQPLPAQSSCLTCPARFYCKNTDATAAQWPTICPTGKYCTAASQPTDCPVGTFNPRQGMISAAECEDCPPGKMCTTTGLSDATVKCTAGYYCVRGVKVVNPPGDSTGGACPAGHYCPEGTITPIACQPGTINDLTGSSSVADCKLCPQRYYCPYRGKTSSDYYIGTATTTFYCSAGYLCFSGASIPTPTDTTTGRKCAIGTYCVADALVETNCAPGTFNPYEGQGSCTSCPVGRLCPLSGMSTYSDCPMAVYCPGGAAVGTPCPAGTYNPITNLESASQCYPCDPGKYCLGGNSATDGTCNAGYVCYRGAKQPTSGAVFVAGTNTEGLCPKGQYCEAGSKAPTPCPVGKYQPLVGQSTCDPCPAGLYCDKTGTIDPSANLCAAGFLCISGSATPSPNDATEGGHPCTAGKYCPSGTTAELDCPAGSYEPRTAAGVCQTCPAGFYCEVGSTTPSQCTAKHYCPQSTTDPIVCPDGTYSNAVGLQSADQCRPCTVGHYCLAGEVTGQCDAGYYCEAYATASNQVSMLCPVGHYCTKGCTTPTVCEKGKVRKTTGAAAASDCTDCDAGSYCVSGVSTPFDCPMGYYCPAKSESPTPCPAGTYSSVTQRTQLEDCLSCPPGYNCTIESIANLTQYLCPVGHYCPISAEEPVQCPNATFSNITGMKAKTDCYTCLYGFYCRVGTVTPVICLEGTYCPAGSSESLDCPAGYYCMYSVYKGSTISYPRACLAGYYCPAKTIYPIKCNNGYYCPVGSSAPTPCPSGTMGNNAENNYDLASSCRSCPPGTYSERSSSENTTCKICPAGYVCVSNTSSKNPVDPDKDGGYVCPKGYYCPEGSYEPTPCPAGTFGNSSCSADSSACMTCEEGTYSSLVGQSGCKTCGPTSISGFGSTTCTCLGENRVFQMADGKCVCKQYYTSVLENDEDDSKYDCRPLLQEDCASGYLRDTLGNCVAQNSCDKECRGGSGKRTPGVGMCECASVQDPDQVCNATCRSSALTVTVNTKGRLVFANSTVINTTSMQIAGEATCDIGGCKVASLSTTAGYFTANYQPSTTLLKQYARQRRLNEAELRRILAVAESTSAIINPAMCISQGDTVTFDVSGNSYPVYLKDAMANTNPSFDYSTFTDLATRISGGESIDMFIYTFNQEGTYVFADSADQTQQTIIAVMNSSETCADTDTYIVPVTSSNLMKMGVVQNEKISLTPDWVFIGCALVALLVLFPGVVVLITYFHNKSWRERASARIAFKRPETEGKKALVTNANATANDISNRPVTEESPMVTSKSVIRITREQNENEVDPHIFDEIYRELKQHSEYVKSEFKKKTGQDSANIATVWAAMRQLKKFVKEKLKAIARIFGKDIKYLFSKPKKPEESEAENEEAVRKLAQDAFRLVHGGQDDTARAEAEDEEDEEQADKARLDEAVRTRTLKDETEMDKYKEDVDRLNKDFMDSYVEMQNKRLENFKEGVLENSRLTEGDKKELLKEYEKQLQRLQKQLLLDQQDIQPHLMQRLEARRNKRLELMRKKDELDRVRRGIRAEHRDKLRQVDEALEINKKKVDEGIDAEIRAKETEIEASRVDNQTKLKAKFDSMLRKTSDAQKRTEILEMFEKASRSLERMYDEDQKRQLDDFKAQLERRRKERHNELSAQSDLDRKATVMQKESQLAQIQDAETLLSNQLANTAIDEKMQEALEADQTKERDEEAALAAIREERGRELSRIGDVEQGRLAAVKEEAAQEEEKMKAESEVQKRMLAHRTKKKCEELNKRKEALVAKLGELGLSEDKKGKIKAELQRIEDEIQRRVSDELMKQEEEFQKALAEKRRLRAAKEDEARASALSKRAAVEEQNAEKMWEERKRIRTEKYRRLTEELKPRMSEAELPVAIERLIDQSHVEELSALLSRQYQEKSKALSARMGDLIEEKLLQAHKIKEELLAQLERLKESKDSGTMPLDEYERRLKELQNRENDELRDLELDYIKKQNELEESLYRAQSQRNGEELMKLKEQQQREKLDILNALALTNGFVGTMLNNTVDPIAELEEYRKQLTDENAKRLRDLERKKQRLQTIAMENEDKIKSFNGETQKLVEEWSAKETERLLRRKHELEEAKKRQEEELRNRLDITEDERKRIMAEYNQELSTLIGAMENEQKRQAALTMEKLEKRAGAKEKLKLQKQIQLALYNKEVDDELEGRIKRNAIRMDTKVEVKDLKEKLNAIVAKGDSAKSVFYKRKALAGVSNAEELELMHSESWLEGGDKLKIDDDDEFRGTILDIDFDKLMVRIVEMQKRVESFSDGNFLQLMEGFRKINGKLSDLKSKAIQQKKR